MAKSQRSEHFDFIGSGSGNRSMQKKKNNKMIKLVLVLFFLQ